MAYINGNHIAFSPRMHTVNRVENWNYVKMLVRNGYGPEAFPIGTKFTIYDSNAKRDFVWVVRAHNHHQVANDSPYTMTLEMESLYTDAQGRSYIQFDEVGAVAFSDTANFWDTQLPAGGNFKMEGRSWGTVDNGKWFSFGFGYDNLEAWELNDQYPEGFQLVIADVEYNQSIEGKMMHLVPMGKTQVLASSIIRLSYQDEFAAGLVLGKGNVNHANRFTAGSNNYAQSAVRQWLNSYEKAGNVWKPQTKFSRPPIGALNEWNGFMSGLPADFLEAVQPALVPCATNAYFETNSIDGTQFTTKQGYTLQDKFFLLSEPETTGTLGASAVRDGTQLEGYKSLTKDERIKYNSGGVSDFYWLRTPKWWSVSYEMGINASGNISENRSITDRTHGVSPACVIA